MLEYSSHLPFFPWGSLQTGCIPQVKAMAPVRLSSLHSSISLDFSNLLRFRPRCCKTLVVSYIPLMTL